MTSFPKGAFMDKSCSVKMDTWGFIFWESWIEGSMIFSVSLKFLSLVYKNNILTWWWQNILTRNVESKNRLIENQSTQDHECPQQILWKIPFCEPRCEWGIFLPDCGNGQQVRVTLWEHYITIPNFIAIWPAVLRATRLSLQQLCEALIYVYLDLVCGKSMYSQYFLHCKLTRCPQTPRYLNIQSVFSNSRRI